jgi:hypothetical protein
MIKMVTQDSATYTLPWEKRSEHIPIDADHSGLVKFPDENHADYRRVLMKLVEFVKDGPAVMERRQEERSKGCIH